jgi:16S rRNA A1518/A1519 N6-dimethyltransferase RsmA/KsgA/DIM1 with predicted DNA glycosylase/AP lyase activity
MSRLDRLELVVRNLADRILGEKITFDQIAEKEAEAQGVVYVPPAAAAPAPDLEPLLARLTALEERPAPVPVPDLEQKVSALTKHVIDQERILQAMLQDASNTGRLVEFILKEGKIYDADRVAEVRKAG